MLIPAVVVYEQRRGLLHRGPKGLLQDLDRFLRAFATIEPLDEHLANAAAEVWARLRGEGRTPGELDLLVLATALGHDATLITQERLEGPKARFPRDPRVTVLDWARLLRRLASSDDRGAAEPRS